jgi:hypothetical protein
VFELLKKYGIPAGIATVVVIALTIIPLFIQFQATADQNARIAALEQSCGIPKK